MIKVLIVIGTRPEAIKMAPLIGILKTYSKEFHLKVCSTGQHKSMLDQALNIFDISPDFKLNVMTPNQTLTDLTSNLLVKIGEVLDSFKPDLVLVHGDTTTALAAAISSFYRRIKVSHIEAGLRTHDLNAPFPEEFNRQVISRIAEFNFAPTETAKTNLMHEGVSHERIYVTGNTVVDALNLILDKVNVDKNFRNEINDELFKTLKFDFLKTRFVLITGHRRENFGHNMKQICQAIGQLSLLEPSVQFVYPVHMNPNVQKPVQESLGHLTNVHLIDPQEYSKFIVLLNSCELVITDSGGIQEEAPSLGVPVLLLRDGTERPEAIENGFATLVGSNSLLIVEETQKILAKQAIDGRKRKGDNPFGDGTASMRIAETILKQLYYQI